MAEPAATGPVATMTYGPMPRGERLVSIDFVRGLALLGILFVNAISFFGPMIAELRPAALSQKPAHDQAVRLLVTALCTTKFISIFAMLFAYGLLTQVERVAAAGRSPWWFAARRLVALGVIGLVHALALWYGDVLFTYATLGLFVVIFRPVKPRDLVILAVVFLAYFALLRMVSEPINLFAEGVTQRFQGQRPRVEGARGLQAIVASGFNPFSPAWVEAEKVASSEGPYQDLFAFRVTQWLMGQLSMAFGSWCLVAGLFFVGMWLYRVRFFAPEQSALRRKTLLICLPLGLTIEGAAAAFYYLGIRDAEHPNSVLWMVGALIQSLSLPVLPLGYLVGMAMLANALPRWLTSPIVATGRMPLTVYLGETGIATTLAYHYGFGWFGNVGPAQQALIAVCIWSTLVVFCRLWLLLFALGPMEWLWRLVEYGGTRPGEAIVPAGATGTTKNTNQTKENE